MPKLNKVYTRKQIDEMRQKLVDEFGNKCMICLKPGTAFKKRLALDHNHKSGRVRGILCYRCNKFMVGRQTIESATKVLNYLLAWDKPEHWE